MSDVTMLESVEAGMPVVFAGNKVVRVSAEIARRFKAGDCLVAVEETGELLHISAEARAVAGEAVSRAHGAFEELSRSSDDALNAFYGAFAKRLEDESVWAEIQRINEADVADASRRGRSTTRLVASEKLRRNMIDGLRGWIATESRRGQIFETVPHDGWRAELIGAPLGVVGFVFEGRPNVLADATGVLRGGNTVVFRIGSDALNTARTIMRVALTPSLLEARLPGGAISLVDSAEHASGWALFSDRRVALAVARGSGPAVATLGALARQAGIPVSLHGTGGAWIVASQTARADSFADAVTRSLDRKVCNTLNTCCICAARATDLVPVFLEALARAGRKLGQDYKLHVVQEDRELVPSALFDRVIAVRRAQGDVHEKQAVPMQESELGVEWEWEQTPEVSLKIVSDVEHAVTLFNRYSPQFVACLVSDDEAEHERFYAGVNAPFVGDGFTRWVDGQFALNRPELGLSNWQWGRLFARGGVLSGDSVFTIRTRVRGTAK